MYVYKYIYIYRHTHTYTYINTHTFIFRAKQNMPRFRAISRYWQTLILYKGKNILVYCKFFSWCGSEVYYNLGHNLDLQKVTVSSGHTKATGNIRSSFIFPQTSYPLSLFCSLTHKVFLYTATVYHSEKTAII